ALRVGRRDRRGAGGVRARPPRRAAARTVGHDALRVAGRRHPGLDPTMKYVATLNDQSRLVNVTGADGRYRVALGDEVWEVDARLTAQGIYSLLIAGVSYVADVTDHDGSCAVDVGDETYVIRVEERTRYIIRTKAGTVRGRAHQTLVAP